MDNLIRFLTEYHPPEGKIRILIETETPLIKGKLDPNISKQFANDPISPFLSKVTESFPRKNKDLHYYELTIP